MLDILFKVTSSASIAWLLLAFYCSSSFVVSDTIDKIKEKLDIACPVLWALFGILFIWIEA